MPFAPRPNSRPSFDWQLRTRALALGPRTLVMGILNVTPDSFSDGGHFYSPEHETDRALSHALTMLDEGAAILDVGGESTRPNSTPLPPSDEQARILPVLTAILKARPAAILSVDTYHAATARLAVEAGAEIVNDVSGHLWDPAMSATCAALGCGTILMHARGRPHEWRTLPPLAHDEVVPLVLRELQARIEAATTAGIPRAKIAIDPGFGFGKIRDENYPLLANLDRLGVLGLPIVSGTSRKGFLGYTLGNATTDRLHATTASNVAAIFAGAHILRVHDVRPAVEAAAIADAVLAAAK